MPLQYSAAVTASRASELAIWTDALTDRGGDRGEILLSISEFPEHKIALPGLPFSQTDCGKTPLLQPVPSGEDAVIAPSCLLQKRQRAFMPGHRPPDSALLTV